MGNAGSKEKIMDAILLALVGLLLFIPVGIISWFLILTG